MYSRIQPYKATWASIQPAQLIQQHRHAAALAIKQHFIGLAPAPGIDFSVIENRVTEGTLDTTFKAAVSLRQFLQGQFHSDAVAQQWAVQDVDSPSRESNL